jgi:enediyne biosynthesis protein E4
LAVGDFNNDGGIDVLISAVDSRPFLLQNNAARDNHWLGLKLIGKRANIDAVGAVVKYQAGDLTRSRMKVGGGSYLSAHDPRIVLGLGKRTKLDWLEIKWPQPSGLIQRFTNLPIDRYITLTEGRANWE